jgi:glycosyltransferase involved in cell wall biosynthesis
MNISACLIIKNEEKYLQNCLQSIKKLCSEIIIVDTGSTDKSIEIAHQFTDKIFHYKWENDYSKARNESLKHATGDYILYIDADEELPQDQEADIFNILLSEKYDAIIFNVKSFLKDSENLNIVRYPRLFRNYKNIAFKYAIHEQIIYSLNEHKARFFQSDFTILHHGYNILREDLIRKKERNLDSIQHIISENPNHEYYRYHLGMTYFSLEKYEHAISELNSLIRDKQYESSEIYNVFALSYTNLNQNQESINYCRLSIKKSAKQYTAWYLLADNLLAEKRYQESIEIFQNYLSIERSDLSSDFQAPISLVHEKLGLAYLMNQNVIESNKHLKKALDFGPINQEHVLLINKYLAITEKYL